MNITLKKYGNSTVAVMPPMVLKALRLSAGHEMQLDTTPEGAIVMSKISKPKKYVLEDLIAQCDASAPTPTDLTEWDCMKPIGNEVW